ncbi:MAG: zinc-dependent metalloprotease [Bacteroidia bacterium]
MKKNTLILTIIFGIISNIAEAKKKPQQQTENKPTPAKNTFAEKTKPCKLYDGLFPIFQDTTNGSIYLVVNKEQLNRTFIYFSYTENGIVATGHNRGIFRDNMVFTIERYFDRIEFIKQNTSFYFDPNNAISKASDANINHANIVSQKIIAEQGDKYLLDGNAIFLNENISQIKPTPPPPTTGVPQLSVLGNLSKDKTKLVKIRNYTGNTDLIVDYVYENPTPRGLGNDVADPRYITITYQHTFIKAPETIMPSRPDDQRIGFFGQQVNDMTTTNAIAYKDVINRWRLDKKEKGAALSEPVKPITWWIENTTPRELRPLIKEAGQKWNIAFEKAGFKNAVVILEQPDTATWDAGDIAYNVLRWTSSPQPPFGGYGPSFVDPRSGEILGADIMLEYVFITNRIHQEKLFDAAQPSFENFNHDKFYCSAGHHLHASDLFGKEVADIRGLSDFEKRDYMKQALYYLILHEMGHTLGLMHNMRASQMWSPAQAHNKTLTQLYGLTASVMDYPAVNIALDKTKQGDYFTTMPGPYDIWAIEYGYSEALDDFDKEKERLESILKRSTDPMLIFGNDADDMRSPGKGVDPRVNINDFSNDVITYSIDRVKLINQIIPKLPEKYRSEGKSNQEMKQAYGICITEWMNATQAISRYVGGVYVNRNMDGKDAFSPVPLAEQKRAMSALAQYVFSPSAVSGNELLYKNLQSQRRGFNFFGTPDDPKIHDRVLMVQTMVLMHLLAPTTLTRINDSRLYGNKYPAIDMLNDLTQACFRDDLNGNVNTFRQNLQITYVKQLCSIFKPNGLSSYDNISKSAILMQLKNIKNMMQTTPAANNELKAHREHIVFLIDDVLAKK